MNFLDLSRIRLNPDTITENPEAIFKNIRVLALEKLKIPVEKFEILSKTFPDLISIVLRGSVLDIPQIFARSSFQSLIKLNLAYCKIKNFSELVPISLYPSLSELKLCSNPILKIEYQGGFQCLKKLNMEGTSVYDLNSLNSLNFFPSLTEIRIGNTPLIDRLKDHSRKIIASYLNKATKINGGYVDGKERTVHERQFVRDFSDPNNSSVQTQSEDYLVNLLGFKIDPEEYNINAEIFQTLLKKHGTVHKFAEVSLAPPSTANLIFETEDGRKEVKEVPLGWKVANLKKLCANLFGIPENKQKLYYQDSEVPMFGMEILRFDNKVLRSLKMKDDDLIKVVVKD